MIPKINGLGRSFAGVAAYCLHDAPEPDDRRPTTSERVGWADIRNLATFRPERAARLMATTAKAAPDLKRLVGGSPGGRKLAKPVLHYSLSWARDETPDRQEMSRAVDGSLEALGLEGHEALIVAHDDTRHPHVHVVANRVDPETGKAAKLGNSKLRLSRWAEGYEREQGRIRCEERVKNNKRRRAGEEVVRTPWERPLHWARFRREGMVPGRVRRARAPVDEGWVDMEAWRRAEAQAWEQVEDRRRLGFSRLESRAEGMGRVAQAAGGHAAEARPGEPHRARAAPNLADRALVAGVGRGGSGPGGPGRELARGSRPAPQGRTSRAGQGTHRQRPADRAEGARGVPKGGGRRGTARADHCPGPCPAGGAGDEGARPQHNPRSPTAAPAPRSRA